MAKKRIIEHTASTTISNDDWLIKDSPTDGTTKIQASVFKTLMNDGMASDEDLADAIENIAGEYDSEVEYSKDALCFKDGVLYIANADTTGTWDSTKWNATTIADIIANLRIDANDVVDVKVKGDSLVNSSKIAVLDSLTAQGSASGNIASFSDGSTHPMSKLEIAIDPIQDLHGYDHPWVGGAGKNKLNLTTRASATERGITSEVKADNTIVASGTSTGNGDITCPVETPFTMEAGETYTISLSGTDTRARQFTIFIGTSYRNVGVISAAEHSLTFTVTSKLVCNQVMLRSSIGATVNINAKLQIEKGSTATTFEPYSNICPISGWSEANVKRTGKNLFSYDLPIRDGYWASATSFQGSNNIVAKENAIGWQYIRLYVEGLSQITLSGFDAQGGTLCAWLGSEDVNDVISTFNSAEKNGTKTVPQDAKYICVVTYSIKTKSESYPNAQIEFGSTATAYEPYNGQTYNIDLDGTRYGGKVDVVNGTMTVDRAIEDLGALNYTKFNVAEGTLFRTSVSGAKLTYNVNNIICSAYKYSSKEARTNGTFSIPDTTNIDFINDSYTTESDFKTAMNGVQLVYELATPQTYQLTPTQVKSLLGTNNVWADTGEVLEAEYVRDVTSTINDIFARIKALEEA